MSGRLKILYSLGGECYAYWWRCGSIVTSMPFRVAINIEQSYISCAALESWLLPGSSFVQAKAGTLGLPLQ